LQTFDDTRALTAVFVEPQLAWTQLQGFDIIAGVIGRWNVAAKEEEESTAAASSCFGQWRFKGEKNYETLSEFQ
jgi:hypothetical protein